VPYSQENSLSLLVTLSAEEQITALLNTPLHLTSYLIGVGPVVFIDFQPFQTFQSLEHPGMRHDYRVVAEVQFSQRSAAVSKIFKCYSLNVVVA